MKELFKSLAAFQSEVPIIHKDAKGYNYSYTNLATIIEVITPLLKKHGLGFIQPLESNKIRTIVYHFESGENIESYTDLPVDSLEYVEATKKNNKGEEYKVTVLQGFEGMNKAQAYGALITYFRRYALSSILGLVTDTDSDARNNRMAQKEQQAEQLEELKELAKLAEISITDMMKVYKTKGYEVTKNKLNDKIKTDEN